MHTQIAPVLEKHYGCDALNLAIQDGLNSGQSVPHVHVHVLPRKKGDFERNDDVYGEIEDQRLDEAHAKAKRTLTLDGDGVGDKVGGKEGGRADLGEDRKARTAEEMAREASELRLLFPHNTPSA